MADDAETPAGEDGADGEEQPKKKKNLILFIALPVVIVLLAGVAAFLLLGGGDEAEAKSEAASEEAAGEDGEYPEGEGDAKGDDSGYGATAPASEVVFYKLPQVLVNIRSDDGRPRYLKLALTLELDSPEAVALIEPAMPRVMDRFQGFLRELRVEDLSGSSGSYRLRLELLRRVNLAVAPAKARAVLIEEMLIQ